MKSNIQTCRAKELLQSLVASAKVQYRHKWQDIADAIWGCGIVNISARSVTVALEDGSRTYEIDGGWTKELYEFVAPPMEPWETAMMAKAVLQNQLRKAGCQEWDTAWWLLCEKFGPDEEDWLPQVIEENGFQKVALELNRAVAAYRLVTPRGQVTPHWDGHLLTWKNQEWPFRNQDRGTVRRVLADVEDNQWKPVYVCLTAEQVHDACRYLNDKTRPYIEWRCSNDGWVQPIY